MWTEIGLGSDQGVDYYERRLLFGLMGVWLTAWPGKWNVTTDGGHTIAYGQALDFEDAKSQAMAAIQLILTDVRKQLGPNHKAEFLARF